MLTENKKTEVREETVNTSCLIHKEDEKHDIHFTGTMLLLGGLLIDLNISYTKKEVNGNK